MASTFSEQEVKVLVTLLIEISELRMKLSHAPDAVLEANAFGKADEDGEEIIEHALIYSGSLADLIHSFQERLRGPDGLASLIAKPLRPGEEKELRWARGEAAQLDAYVAKKAH